VCVVVITLTGDTFPSVTIMDNNNEYRKSCVKDVLESPGPLSYRSVMFLTRLSYEFVVSFELSL
jgi:hypothetical protein